MGAPLSTWKLHKNLRRTLWPVPTLAALLGALAGAGLPVLEASRPHLFPVVPWLQELFGEPEGPRMLLSTSAGALATVLGVVSTLTVVVLQLAASQYSARILPRFMRSRMTRAVLAGYLATIVYLLFVLTSVPPPRQHADPIWSTVLGLLMTVACFVLLVVYIHHLAWSIQVSTIVARIARSAIDVHARTSRAQQHAPAEADAVPPAPQCTRVTAASPGFLEHFDAERLLEVLPATVQRARVEARLGDFMLPDAPLVSLWPPVELSDEELHNVRSAFSVGRERTDRGDVLYLVRQLVDIALRALSPGINEVTTAVMVVNELGTVAHAVASSGVLGDDSFTGLRRADGKLLLIPRFGLDTFLGHAFGELPDAARGHPRVHSRILEVLGHLAAHALEIVRMDQVGEAKVGRR
ncbi:MAG: DUF2254 domain-containing protein [Myxococcales bacterium]